MMKFNNGNYRDEAICKIRQFFYFTERKIGQFCYSFSLLLPELTDAGKLHPKNCERENRPLGYF